MHCIAAAAEWGMDTENLPNDIFFPPIQIIFLRMCIFFLGNEKLGDKPSLA